MDENELFNQLTKYCKNYKEKIPNEKGDKVKSSLAFLKNKAKTLEDIYKNSKYIIQNKVTINQDDIKLIDDKAKKILTDKIEDLHKLAKALLTYETLSGEEIEDIVNKNIYPSNKEDLKVEDDDKGSALGSIGLKPKIVH